MTPAQRKKLLAERRDKYKSVFDSEDGRWVLRDLMGECHVLTSTFDENTNIMARKSGQRDVFTHILMCIECYPDDYLKLIGAQTHE